MMNLSTVTQQTVLNGLESVLPIRFQPLHHVGVFLLVFVTLWWGSAGTHD